MASELEITDDQKKDLKKAERQIQEELAREIEALRSKARRKLFSNLGQQQQSKLETIIGDEFEFDNLESKKSKPGSKRDDSKAFLPK